MPFDNFRKRSQDTSHRPAERPEQERSSSSSNPFLWPQPSHGQHEQGARAYAETLADAYAGNASDSSTLVGTLGTSSTSSHLQPYYHSLQTALQRGLSMDQAPMHPQAVPPGGMSHRGSTFPGVPRIMPPPGPVYSSVPSFTPKRTYDEVQTSPVSPTTSRFYPQPKRPREGSSQFPDSSAAPSLDEQKWHYANAIKGLNKSVIQEFQQYLIQRNVENRKNRQKSAEKGNVTRGALLDMGGLIEDVDSVKEFLEAPRPDAMLISKVNIAFDRIASYVSDPSKKNSNVNAMREQLQHVRVLQGRETRPDAAVSGGERQTEVNWSNLGLKQKLSGPLEIDALSRTVESLSVHDLPLTQTAGPSYDDILRRNITQSSLQSPGHLSRSDVGGKLAMVKEEVSESDILEVERRREVMEVYDQEDLSRRAHQKMKSAWDVWKKTFRERLPEIQQNYEDPFFQRGKGKQKAKLTYSETNPAVFFAQVVTNDGFVYRSQDGGKSTEHTFTVDDLVHAMNPRFKEFGHAFLQQEWRVTEGQSWASSKKYKPGDSVPPGDQRMDGQHEWLPTAKVPTILHTILQKYPKQEQLAWISALDILRTPTSEVAINFAWNQKINVADVNKHPERYTTSQIGIWEHHSAGMFSPQQQLNKGNGPFHDKINKLIDTFLASNKSQLLELLESLKDFVEENMYGGKLLHNPGLNEDAMKRIKNDLTRQSQKTYSQRAEPYGRLSHTNQMAEVRHESENETIGTILFRACLLGWIVSKKERKEVM